MSAEFFFIGGGARITLELTARVASGANTDTYNFADVPIGEPAEDRIVVVAAIQTASDNFASGALIRINGVTANSIAGFTLGGVRNIAGISFLPVPTGATADISVDIFGGNDCTIYVFILRGAASPWPFAEGYVSTSGASSSLTLSIPRSGLALYVGGQQNSATASWSHATVIADGTVENRYTSAASRVARHDLIDEVETRSWTGNALGSLIGISWQSKAARYPILHGRQISGTSLDNTATTFNVPILGGEVGDIILIVASVQANAARTISAPSGWIELYTGVGGGNMRRQSAFYRIADGTEGANVTLSASGASRWMIVSYRVGKHHGAIEAGTPATGNSSAATPPNLSPSWGMKPTLWIAVAADTANVLDRAGWPSGFCLPQSGIQVFLGTVSLRAHCAHRYQPVSSMSPGSFALGGSGQWIANTIAIY